MSTVLASETDFVLKNNDGEYKIFVRDALRQAMYEAMAEDPDVFIMGEEVALYRGAYKVTGDLFEIFNTSDQDRVIDTPITEHGFAGIGVGAAFAGLRPIVEFMTFNFALQAIDQIINSAAKTKYMSGGQVGCPIVFRGPNGAAAGVAAQHSHSFGSMYAHIPGLKVIAPYHADDCRGLLKAAIKDNDPVIFLEYELVYGEAHEVPISYYNKQFFDKLLLDKANKGKTIPKEFSENEYFNKEFGSDNEYLIGKAKILKHGKDVTVIGYSRMIKFILEAEKILADEDIDIEIIDLRTLRPLDTETIVNSVNKTNLAVVVDEEWPQYSVASEIIALINDRCFDYLDGPVARVNAEDVPLPYAKNLEYLALPNTEKVVNKIRKLVRREI